MNDIENQEYHQSRFAAGQVREWDLRLREWRREFRRKNGEPPSKPREEEYFTSIAHLTGWVMDPDFGQPMTEQQIEEVWNALDGNRTLQRDFSKFLKRRFTPVTEVSHGTTLP